MIIKYNPKLKYLRRPGTDEIFIWTEYLEKQFPELVEWIPSSDERLGEVKAGVGEHTKSNLKRKQIEKALSEIPKEKWSKKFGARPAMPKIADIRALGYMDITLEEVLGVLKNDTTSIEAEGSKQAQ